MENKKEINKCIKDFFKEVAKPIVPQEVLSNPRRGSDSKIIRLIQPHNFRRYFVFSKDTYNPTQPYSEKNYKSEHHYTNFYGCTIIIRKKTAEVINLWHQKQWRLLEANTINEVNERIDQIEKEMEETTIKAMQKFISVNGGHSDLKPIKKRETEIGIHGDDYLDKIPPEMVINDTYFKKVYKEKVEFLGEESVKSYIKGKITFDIAPDIAQELNNIYKSIDKLSPILEKQYEATILEIKNKRLHQKVLNSMDRTLKDIRNDLIQRRIREYL